MREILDHPDDDAPRIVYADWLEQHVGDPESLARADLIHAQCELEHAGPADRPALHARIKTVLKAYRRKWTEGLTRAMIRGSWRFRRGFLDGGTMAATRFVAVAETLFDHAPMLRSMVFPEASNELVALARCSYLARLVTVDLDELCRCGRCKIERELPDLFASPHVAGIRDLILSNDRMDSDNAIKLAESPHLRGLLSLDLSDNRIDPRGAEALAHLDRNLRTLVLRTNPLGDIGVVAIARAPQLRLTSLDLSSTGMTEVGAAALVQSPWADTLVSLDLRGNKLGRGALRLGLRRRFGSALRL